MACSQTVINRDTVGSRTSKAGLAMIPHWRHGPNTHALSLCHLPLEVITLERNCTKLKPMSKDMSVHMKAKVNPLGLYHVWEC